MYATDDACDSDASGIHSYHSENGDWHPVLEPKLTQTQSSWQLIRASDACSERERKKDIAVLDSCVHVCVQCGISVLYDI